MFGKTPNMFLPTHVFMVIFISTKKQIQEMLVGGSTNPSEKYARQIGSFPQFWDWT